MDRLNRFFLVLSVILASQSGYGSYVIQNGSVSTAKLASHAVTNAKAAQMSAHTVKGNNTGSTADSLDMTQAQLGAELTTQVGMLMSAQTTTGDRVERASISAGGGCSTFSGSWLSGCAGVTSSGVTLSINSGMFSAAPTCTCSFGNYIGACRFLSINSSSIQVAAVNLSSAGINADLNIICQGPR